MLPENINAQTSVGDKKKVLIVEDETEIANMYKIKLEKVGYQVFLEGNGNAAIEKIEEYNPDVVLLDIMMPGMNGIDTLKAIKENKKVSPKIIMVTNVYNRNFINQCIAAGSDGYIVKAQTTPKEIVETVDKFIKS